MKNCVSLETAKDLKEAGFGPSLENPIGFYYIGNSLIKANSIVDLLGKESSYAPSAVEILDQMPIRTTLMKGKGEWFCQLKGILSANKCPHEAAASAFLMWKSTQP